MTHSLFSIPHLSAPVDARSFRGRRGSELRSALAERLPLRRHAQRRISRRGRLIPRELVRLVIRHGAPQQRACGVRLRLRGVPRPAGVSAHLWAAALPVVVPVDGFGWIPTVFREGRSK